MFYTYISLLISLLLLFLGGDVIKDGGAQLNVDEGLNMHFIYSLSYLNQILFFVVQQKMLSFVEMNLCFALRDILHCR